ncbi:MAG TPA: hypothetical protein VEJ45_09765 [Candidatus Acidoferrales bacterium]|nr:hypothetical protein [Candidatus Acidoferrales bacterium]
MRRITIVTVLAVLLIPMLRASVAFGQEAPLVPGVSTLKGISGVQVLIEDLSDSAKALGLEKETIQTDVELKLRLAGIHILSEEEDNNTPGAPSLYVNVRVVRSAAAVAVELKQGVRLVRNGELSQGTTWSVGGVGANLTAESIRNHIKDYLDEFLNAWLSVNPRK